MRWVLVVLTMSGCATGLVKKVDFSQRLDLRKSQPLGCAWVADEKRLICLSMEDAERILGEQDLKETY